jgi:hypothetical protein
MALAPVLCLPISVQLFPCSAYCSALKTEEAHCYELVRTAVRTQIWLRSHYFAVIV